MNDASALKSDEEIVQYILSHASAFEFNSVRAIKKRDELLEDARRLAQEEISDCEQYKYDNGGKNAYIYGYKYFHILLHALTSFRFYILS